MHQALREKVEEDVRVLGDAVAALESGGPGGQKALEDLRQLRRRKEESLENGPVPGPGRRERRRRI